MKTLIIFAIFYTFVPIANAQQEELSLKELNLKGKVKEITEYLYIGEINQLNVDTLEQTGESITKFDRIGNKIETANYDKYGVLRNKHFYNYKNDTVVIISNYDADDKLKYQHKYVFKYNIDGSKIEFEEYNITVSKLLSKFVYKYDKNGNMVEKDDYSPGIDPPIRDIFLLNKKNQIIERDLYINGGNQFYKSIMTYDQLGNQIKKELYNIDGKLDMINSITYNYIDKYENWLSQIYESKGNNKYRGDYILKTVTKRVIKYY
ncbi:MAG TPA: hypothetical protein VK668_13430 [Mucilaginibacter sp.]|nr:hypothetical protein [Mucilaginibacter sp.]